MVKQSVLQRGAMETTTPANPYSAPNSELQLLERPLGTELEPELAGRGVRLGAHLLDMMLWWLGAVPGFVVMTAMQGHPSESTQEGVGLSLMALGLTAIAVWNWVWITQSGQSIAKRMLKLQIRRIDGSPCGFVHGVVLRSWVITIVNAICPLGGLLAIVDGALIFGEERRCLHDLLADTKVVNLGPPVGAAPADPAMRFVVPGAGLSPMALVAGYLGLLSILVVPAPFAILFGVLGLREVRNRQMYGEGRAWFGIIAGSLTCVGAAVAVVVA